MLYSFSEEFLKGFVSYTYLVCYVIRTCCFKLHIVYSLLSYSNFLLESKYHYYIFVFPEKTFQCNHILYPHWELSKRIFRRFFILRCLLFNLQGGPKFSLPIYVSNNKHQIYEGPCVIIIKIWRKMQTLKLTSKGLVITNSI